MGTVTDSDSRARQVLRRRRRRPRVGGQEGGRARNGARRRGNRPADDDGTLRPLLVGGSWSPFARGWWVVGARALLSRTRRRRQRRGRRPTNERPETDQPEPNLGLTLLMSASTSVPAATLEPTAAQMTPPTIGISQKLTAKPSILPSMMNPNATEKIGSSACRQPAAPPHPRVPASPAGP